MYFLKIGNLIHYFEINETVLQWQRGDAIIIEKDEPDPSGNFGMKPKVHYANYWSEE